MITNDFTHLLPSLAEEFDDLLARVVEDHRKHTNEAAHGIAHTLTATNSTLKIAENKTTARLAWVAALLNNTDRLFS